MEKREKAVLKRERREQRKQTTDAGPSTFSTPNQQADLAEPESGPSVSLDGESSWRQLASLEFNTT